MSKYRASVRFGLLLAVLWFAADSSRAQLMFVGFGGTNGSPVTVAGVETFLQTGYGATRDGIVNEAIFSWSQAPCPGAVKIKFFRPSNAVPGGEFLYLEQRGPFDVTSMRQTVRLDPPVALHAGDIIAITNLTSCGGPVTALQVTPGGLAGPGPYYAVPGDVVTNIVLTTPVPTSGPALNLYAVDQPSLFLLKERFRVTLLAINPRNLSIADGYPVLLGDSAGYFSLPDFTGDATFPEVIVKMVDATGSPALGGGFWFFYAPLTDVQYTITVTDQVTGKRRTYANSPGGPGELCGGADTSAFPGP